MGWIAHPNNGWLHFQFSQLISNFLAGVWSGLFSHHPQETKKKWLEHLYRTVINSSISKVLFVSCVIFLPCLSFVQPLSPN